MVTSHVVCSAPPRKPHQKIKAVTFTQQINAFCFPYSSERKIPKNPSSYSVPFFPHLVPITQGITTKVGIFSWTTQRLNFSQKLICILIFLLLPPKTKSRLTTREKQDFLKSPRTPIFVAKLQNTEHVISHDLKVRVVSCLFSIMAIAKCIIRVFLEGASNISKKHISFFPKPLNLLLALGDVLWAGTFHAKKEKERFSPSKSQGSDVPWFPDILKETLWKIPEILLPATHSCFALREIEFWHTDILFWELALWHSFILYFPNHIMFRHTRPKRCTFSPKRVRFHP